MKEMARFQEPLMPLSIAKPGERLIIRDIIGGRGITERLLSMGIRIGDKIEVISNMGFGRLIIAKDQIRIAVGRGVANKILVSKTED